MFSTFSGLKPNTGKCETGVGVLKGVHMAACGMKCIDLTKESIKTSKNAMWTPAIQKTIKRKLTE